MTALHGAFALAELDAVAVLVGEDLHLDVARVDDELLDIDFVVAKRALRFALRSLEAERRSRAKRPAHALAATAGRRLQHDGIADLSASFSAASGARVPSRTGTNGTPAFFMFCRARVLDPIISIDSGGGPMNLMPDSRQARAKFAIFREEAVAGMNRLGAAELRYIEDLRQRSDRTRWPGRTDVVRVVGLADVKRAAINI